MATRDQSDAAPLIHIFKVDLANVAVDERDYPKFALDKFIEVLHQILVPHEVSLPRPCLRFLDLQ